jgi:hypothetical protein
MASNAKKKTTMAKLNRERALQERRMEKQVKKAMRKRAAAEEQTTETAETTETPVEQAP